MILTDVFICPKKPKKKKLSLTFQCQVNDIFQVKQALYSIIIRIKVKKHFCKSFYLIKVNLLTEYNLKNT